MRLSYIDYIKTLCIVLMVVCHWGLKNDVALTLIYGFHMPMLFMVSGYLYKKRSVKDEIISFGIPILFYSVLSIAWSYGFAFFKGSNAETLYEYLSKTIPAFFIANHGDYHTPFTGIWFIMGLWFVRLFLYNLDINSKYVIVLIVFCIVITETNNLFHYSQILSDLYLLKPIQILPYFFLGYYLKKNPPSIRIHSALLVLIFIVLSLYNGKIYMYYGNFGKMYVIAIAQNIVLFLAFKSLLDLKRNLFVEKISIGTFFVLGTHSILFPNLVNLGEKFLNSRGGGILIVALIYFLFMVPLISVLSNKCPVILGKVPRCKIVK